VNCFDPTSGGATLEDTPVLQGDKRGVEPGTDGDDRAGVLRPAQLLFNAEPLYFIQTPQEIWILWQRDHLVRRVFLNREHSRDLKASWFGESVGHYENDQLIIDTIGFVEHPYSFLDNWRTPHTKDLHMEERWKLLDSGNAIEATVTFDDQGAFNLPWSGMVRWPMLE
jgi:hypothetical protein